MHIFIGNLLLETTKAKFDFVINFNPTITKEYGLSPCGTCRTMSLNNVFQSSNLCVHEHG